MAKNRNKNRVFRYNRRIQQKTDYKLRLKLLKSKLVRVVVRRSNNNVTVQFVKYAEKGDAIIASARSVDLKKLGYTLHTGNIVAAHLTGMLAAKRFLKKSQEDCVVDMGLQGIKYGSRLFAAVKGCVDGGANIRVKDVVFPSEERLSGTHLKAKDAKSVIEKTVKAVEAL